MPGGPREDQFQEVGRGGVGRDPGEGKSCGFISSGLVREGEQTRDGPSDRYKSHIMETTGSEGGVWPAGGQVHRLAPSADAVKGVSRQHLARLSVPCPP